MAAFLPPYTLSQCSARAADMAFAYAWKTRHLGRVPAPPGGPSPARGTPPSTPALPTAAAWQVALSCNPLTFREVGRVLPALLYPGALLPAPGVLKGPLPPLTGARDCHSLAYRPAWTGGHMLTRLEVKGSRGGRKKQRDLLVLYLAGPPQPLPLPGLCHLAPLARAAPGPVCVGWGT